MKERFQRLGLSKLCGWFGLTRQAYYQQSDREEECLKKQEVLLKEIREIRGKHKRMGTRKLYELLTPALEAHGIKMGRDKLFELMSSEGLLVRKRRRNVRTTFSNHWLRKYPNLARGFVPSAPNQLWVSDITYWKTEWFTVYVTLVTDAYSHRIVGYQLAQTLEAVECSKALRMALSSLGSGRPERLVHHSDRGLQYCSREYTGLLKEYGIQISMTESGDHLENAVAERVNGILKDEYLEAQDIRTAGDAASYLHTAVLLYNSERPHMSISNLTPMRFIRRLKISM